jgi:hypothetical protein
MSGIDLADTAVKIGLGAFIAGFFALLASRRQHIHELDRERMKRRERVLERTAEEFELAYQTLALKYDRVLALARIVTGEKFRINAQDSISGVNDFPQLHIVESRLLLLGLKKEGEMVMRFRQIAGEFEKLALPQDKSHPNPETLNLKLEELFRERGAIYSRLAEFFDDPRKKV